MFCTITDTRSTVGLLICPGNCLIYEEIKITNIYRTCTNNWIDKVEDTYMKIRELLESNKS